MKRLQYWTEVDPEYTQEAADAIEQLDAETYDGPTDEEIAAYEAAGEVEIRMGKIHNSMELQCIVCEELMTLETNSIAGQEKISCSSCGACYKVVYEHPNINYRLIPKETPIRRAGTIH